MAAKKQQTHAKRARELAVKERRERKRARKAERAIAAEEGAPLDGDDDGAFLHGELACPLRVRLLLLSRHPPAPFSRLERPAAASTTAAARPPSN